MLRQASEAGQLYGSVSPRDLAGLLNDGGFAVDRNQIALNVPIKTIGAHKVPVQLHPEVEVTITVNVARSADEAERLARGEDVTVRREQRRRRGGSGRGQGGGGSLLRAGGASRARGQPDGEKADGEAGRRRPSRRPERR